MQDTILLLISGLVLIFISTVVFTNTIEHIARKMRWSHSFTGAIVAPLITSFPELTVFVIAVFIYRGISGDEIGIGTILGEPFMASTIAYTLVFVSIIIAMFFNKRKKRDLKIDKVLRIPYAFIVILFPLILIPYFFNISILKYLFAALFLGSYGYYMVLMYRNRAAEHVEETGTLMLGRVLAPNFALILQLILSIAGIYFGSSILVQSIEQVSVNTGLSALATAIILVPVGTAIPETLSAMIWAYKGKDNFAISSLVGEKVLYSTFYPGLALLLVPWLLDYYAYISVIATTTISLIYLYYINKGRIPSYALLFGVIFFIIYIFLVFPYL
ncbi:MAG: sodium:calcium antiporter [Thermoplasmata archaeon]